MRPDHQIFPAEPEKWYVCELLLGKKREKIQPVKYASRRFRGGFNTEEQARAEQVRFEAEFGIETELWQCPVNAEDVARWMIEQFDKYGCIYQTSISELIVHQFGMEFVEPSQTSAGFMIREDVKRAFRKLHRGTIKWDNRTKSWSKARNPTDASPGNS